MSTSKIILIAIGAFFLIVLFWGCNGYNSLVNADQNIQEKGSVLQADYQRRMDLYNTVIKTIEGSANFEKSTLKEVLEARAKATQVKVDINDPATLEAYQKAQAGLQSSFGRLMAVAEAYPNLKTSDAFLDFQKQQEGTENRIKTARMDYSKAVGEYNLKVKRFPGNILAGLFGYSPKPFYKADEGAEKVPDLKFKNN